MIDIGELIRTARPDREGRILPASVREGSLKVTSLVGNSLGLDVVMSEGIYNPTKATCGSGCNTCTGLTSTYTTPGSFSIPVQGQQQIRFGWVDAYGYQHDVGSSSVWQSTNPAVLSVNLGLATGLSGGNGGVTVNYSAPIPTNAGQVCRSACPYVLSIAGGATATVVACPFPSGETTQWLGWDEVSFPNAGVGKWVQTLASPTYSWARTVSESIGSPATDGCYFSGSFYGPREIITGGSWPVNANNVWGPDYVGWADPTIIKYYQRVRLERGLPMPCELRGFQRLRISCGSQTPTVYRDIVILQGIISASGVSSGRDGNLAGRSIP